MTSENLPISVEPIIITSDISLLSITSNDITTIWPITAGTIGQALISDGIGGLTWGASGGTGVTSILGTMNQITVSTPTGTVTLNLPQDIATTSSVAFTNLTLSSLTANQLVYSNGSKTLTSVTSGSGITFSSGTLSNSGVVSLAGTANRVSVSSSTGAITLNLPQDIATTSSVRFARLLGSSIDANSTFIGDNSGLNLTTGIGNTAVGLDTCQLITTGDYNLAIGPYAGKSISTGSNNVAIGYNALTGPDPSIRTITGSSNVAIGTDSLRAVRYGASVNIGIGTASGLQLETGSFNTFIGPFAGSGLATGSYNLYIGSLATASLDNVNYEGIINTSSIPGVGQGSNTMTIVAPSGLYYYNSAICYLYATGISNGRVQWATWDTNNVPTKGFYLANYGNGANTAIVPNVYGHYEITINGGMLGNGSALTLTFNNVNVQPKTIWYQSFSQNGIAYSLSATLIARPYTVVNLSGFEFQLTNMTLWSSLYLYVCIKFIGF